MQQDIEGFIDENGQTHPQVPNDQEKASNILELEELSTLEEENIIEQQNDDDSVIGDQLDNACDLIQHIKNKNKNIKR